MIDIHSHILPFVDDGSPELSLSIEMLRKVSSQGVEHIILTPHALRSDFKFISKEDIIKNFNSFKAEVAKENLDINIYLGQEVSFRFDLFDHYHSGELLTLNNTNYLLFELPLHYKLRNITSVIYNLQAAGFQVVLSHIERYLYYSFEELSELKEMGVFFQVNASSIVKPKRKVKRVTKRLFKNNYVDFVAGDIHYNRNYYMKEAYEVVEKKYGSYIAQKVFYENAKSIIF